MTICHESSLPVTQVFDFCMIIRHNILNIILNGNGRLSRADVRFFWHRFCLTVVVKKND